AANAAQPGDRVSVPYIGWVLDGDRIDCSYDRGDPFTFSLGTGSVIAGFDEGVTGMKEGEVRVLVLPPDLAYGAHGAGPSIPPDSWIKFLVDMVAIEGD
ncbi:FKBP-type peptidyl-prolyl cis-trans isomerase, partial [bacterium]|nr:FKBP-type peptidyl-prolyl cis-trans isomerase [bacterium]